MSLTSKKISYIYYTIRPFPFALFTNTVDQCHNKPFALFWLITSSSELIWFYKTLVYVSSKLKGVMKFNCKLYHSEFLQLRTRRKNFSMFSWPFCGPKDSFNCCHHTGFFDRSVIFHTPIKSHQKCSLRLILAEKSSLVHDILTKICPL